MFHAICNASSCKWIKKKLQFQYSFIFKILSLGSRETIIVCSVGEMPMTTLAMRKFIEVSVWERDREREENKTDYWCKNVRMWLKNLCQIGTKFNLFHRNVGEDAEAKSKG